MSSDVCRDESGQVWERQDFESAGEKYAALVAAFRECSTVQRRLSNYTATYELSAIEAEIFGIDPALMAELFWAYQRYESLIGTVDAYFEEHRVQERIDYAAYFHGECVYAMGYAADFMVEACGLPYTQCYGWVMKVVASQLRGGLMDHNE